MMTRRHLGIALKLLISLTLVWVLLDAVGAKDALSRVRDIDPLWFVAALLFGLSQMLIGVMRWRAVLAAIDTPLDFFPAFRLTFIGGFFNQTLPSSVGGDAVRAYMAYKSGVKLAPALNSVLLDRIATVLGLVVLVAVMTPVAAGGLQGGEWFAGAVWLVLVVALAGTAVVMVMDRLPERIRHWRVVVGLGALAVDARRAFLHPRSVFLVMMWALLGHVNLSMIVYALAQGLAVDMSLADCLLLFPPVLLIQTVPISVAGWGVREGAMVALFALAGVSGEEALAVSILYGVVLATTSLPGAAYWLAGERKTVREAEAFANH